jgi:hypothetical protein
LEFESGEMKEFFRQKGIEKFGARPGNVKAAVVERFIKTMKQRMYRWFSEKNSVRWIEVLPKIINAMNNTINTATGMTPNINPKNAGKLWDKLYHQYLFPETRGKRPRYKPGDAVRLSKKRRTFEKGYLANFTGLLRPFFLYICCVP